MSYITEQVQILEEKQSILESLRSAARIPSSDKDGELSQFGKDFLLACVNNNLEPKYVATVLGLRHGFVSAEMRKLRK